MKNYKYTENWFNSTDLEQFLPLNTQDELHILEIGSFEGKSTIWFLENVLQNPNSTITCIDPWTSYSQDLNSFSSYNQIDTEWNFKNHKNTFLHNIKESELENKVIINQGMSHEILPQLITQNKKFDIIFIDGNHVAPFVLSDAVMSWYLLNTNGIIIFDDYSWGNQDQRSPKPAIDSFIYSFSDYCEIIWEGYRKAIKKI
jgi:predicted O-methyltransferase YrrM